MGFCVLKKKGALLGAAILRRGGGRITPPHLTHLWFDPFSPVLLLVLLLSFLRNQEPHQDTHSLPSLVAIPELVFLTINQEGVYLPDQRCPRLFHSQRQQEVRCHEAKNAVLEPDMRLQKAIEHLFELLVVHRLRISHLPTFQPGLQKAVLLLELLVLVHQFCQGLHHHVHTEAPVFLTILQSGVGRLQLTLEQVDFAVLTGDVLVVHACDEEVEAEEDDTARASEEDEQERHLQRLENLRRHRLVLRCHGLGSLQKHSTSDVSEATLALPLQRHATIA